MVTPDPNDLNARVRTRAFSLLAGRELSREQLRQSLLRAFPDQLATIEHVVEEFVDKGWQSDERSAELLSHQAQRSGWGPRRLRYQQKKRGLPDSGLPTDIDWLALAHAQILRRFGDVPERVESTLRLRILRFLAGRGFTEEQAHQAYRRWLETKGVS